MEKKRSVGILAIGFSVIILGLYKSPLSIWKISYIITNFSQTIRQLGFLMSFLYIPESLLSICFIIGGVGFLLLKKWAIYLLRISLLIDIIFHLFFTIKIWFFQLSVFRPFVGFIILFVELIFYFFLTRPKVKEQFK